MAAITATDLGRMIEDVRPATADWPVSQYLPELGKVENSTLGACVALSEQEEVSGGMSDTGFTLQSVAKVFTLLLALRDHGRDEVFRHVGCEPAMGAFDSFDTFDRIRGIPANPFVNSGALTIVDLLQGRDCAEKIDRVMYLLQSLSGGNSFDIDIDLAESEFARSDRNRALCYFLRSAGFVSGDVEQLLWTYCQLCAIRTDCRSLARAAASLAGTHSIRSCLPPRDLIEAPTVRRLMLHTGMYLDSGRYACEVGIPSKCGISGAMIGILAGRGGIAIYGPALGEGSNSVGGTRLMAHLSKRLEVL